MLNNITITSVISKNSILYKVNPIVKIISLLIILVLSICSNSLESHIILISFIIITYFLSKTDYYIYTNLMIKSKYFLLGIFLLNLFFMDIYHSLLCIIRIIEVMVYSKIILHTTDISAMNYGIQVLCTPLKFVHINPLFISMSITLTIRFIPILITTAQKIMKTLYVRGVFFTSNIKKDIQLLLKLMIPTFKKALEKADTIAIMMEMKHFSFEKKRSNYFTYSISFYDILSIGILIGISILVIRGEIV